MKGINIGFDAKRAVMNATGLGNYSRLVAATMSALYPHNHYVMYSPRRRENPRLDQLLMRENVEMAYPGGMWRHMPSLWRSGGIAADVARMGIDLYHGLSNELPMVKLPCATVVTIHDLIWRRVPEDYSAIDRRLYDLKYSHAARTASRIIAISERTRDDIVADWGIDPARIDVIYQGCDPAFSRRPDFDERRRVRQAHGIEGRYIVSVGTVQSRKNQLLALEALATLGPDYADVKFVIVGRGDNDYGRRVRARVARPDLAGRVIWLDNAPFDDLPAIYAGAELSTYTSRYEGFGLPVIESLSCGTPVVACTGSCLEEAGGRGALYVGPDDVAEAARAIASLLDKAYLRERLAGDGRRHIKRFDTASFGSSMMATYNKAMLSHSLKDL